jgi:hypothetical protein
MAKVDREYVENKISIRSGRSESMKLLIKDKDDSIIKMNLKNSEAVMNHYIPDYKVDYQQVPYIPISTNNSKSVSRVPYDQSAKIPTRVAGGSLMLHVGRQSGMISSDMKSHQNSIFNRNT